MAESLVQYWLPSATELRLFGPDLALVGTLIVILVGAMIVGKRPRVCAALAAVGVIVALGLNVQVAGLLSETAGGFQGAMEPAAGRPMLIADSLTVFFKFVLLVFLLAVTLLWRVGGSAAVPDAPEFLVLLLGSALGMSLMVSTLNVLMIVIAIELASLPSYAIVAFDKRSRPGAEGALKYVVFGSASAGIMLYGASLLYGLFGTLDLSVMAGRIAQTLQQGEDRLLLAVALFTFLVGVGFKISAVPFHFWCPDVFEGARIEVTTWLSVASKAAGLCLLLRIMYTLAVAAGGSAVETLEPMTRAVATFAALTCFVGNLAAYRQTSVKRMLAYSSIAHAGYMLMLGAITLQQSASTDVFVALICYVVMYLFMNLGAFGATALVVWQTGSDRIEEFNGLGRRCPWLAFGMTVCLFSLIGMPPLGGFLAKWWLLYALANQGGWLYLLVIWLSLNTLFSLFYYMRIIKHMYMVDDGRERLSASLPGLVLVNLCAVVLLLGGTLGADYFKTQAAEYADGLFEPGVQAHELAESH